jgi:RNAse (barnase) inhibitor barstar
VGEWYLEDVRITSVRPCARDLSLTDLTVEAVRCDGEPDYPAKPALSPGYGLSTGWPAVRLGAAKDVAWIETPQPQNEVADTVPMRLLGGEPGAGLLKALERDDDFELRAWLELFDRTGRTMRSTFSTWYVTSWEPSPHGPGLVDLTVDCSDEDRPPLAAGRVYELWAEGPPTEKNLWTELGPDGRWAWLELALGRYTRRAEDIPTGGTYRLDGSSVTDQSSFYCALGEAVNGSGGYYGWNLDAVIDCTRGGFGAKPPFTLVWQDADVGRRCLGQSPLILAPPTFEELVDLLVEQGVDVVLA